MDHHQPRKTRFPRLSRFWADEAGTGITEFVIVFPLLVWAWIGMYCYWDVYRSLNLAQKASFTVSDNLSRSNGEINKAYIDGLREFVTFLAQTDEDVAIRVSSIGWDAVGQKHVVLWSYSPDNAFPVLTNGLLTEIDDQIPTLVQFETVLLLETQIDYESPIGIDKVAGIDIGVGPRTFREFVVTRPRFVPKVCLVGTVCT